MIKTIFHGSRAFVTSLPGGKSQEHVRLPGTQSHVHDRDEKEGDDSVSYGNSLKNG